MNEYPGIYQTTTIKSIIQDIYHRELLIPDFKKEFVWNHEQIETLFDSIFKGYPIGTFLFWQNNDAAKFKLYDFINDFSEFESSNYGTETCPNKDSFKTIIDGQQRLTALCIALKGTYAYHTKYTRIYDKTGYPPQKLFFLYCNYQTPHDKLFNFMDPAYATTEQSFIELEAFLNYNSAEELIDDIQEKYQKTVKEKDITAIRILYNRINNDPTISYCTLNNELNDETLDIFVRTNPATTPLTKSELLMSLTTGNWGYGIAKQQFSELIRKVERIKTPGFIIDNDFILKCYFMLTDITTVGLTINYMQKKIKSIKENWFNIRSAILKTFKLLKELGFNNVSTKDKYAIIPIIYWIYSRSPQTIDHNQIRKWLIYTYLNDINFGNGLNIIKGIINKAATDTFPSEQINEYYRNIRSHDITDDYIEKLLTSKYGTAQSWYLLLLLYPEIVANSYKNRIIQDHIHPAISFENGNLISIYNNNHKRAATEDERSFALKYYDTVLNLQLLPAENNKYDTDLETWHKQNPEYNLYIDKGISLKIKDFRAFIENRKQNLKKRLKEILQN